MSPNTLPKIHGPIDAEQARELAEADLPAAQALLKQVGIEDPRASDVIAVSGSDNEPPRYISANPSDIGTRLLAGTEQELGLPPLALSNQSHDTGDKGRGIIIVSQPGDPGHEAKVAEWRRSQEIAQAAADEIRNRSNG